MRTLTVGLTGGIACGKTRVMRRLAASGAAGLDLDGLAHEVIAPAGAAYAPVVERFGRDILDPSGVIDRKRLGARVFADPAALAELNTIVHPLVRQEEARRVAALAASGARVIVSEAALLVESGVHLRFDRLVVVHCAPDIQLRRLMARDGIDEVAARQRIASQLPIDVKRTFARVQVDTSGSLADTDAAADRCAAAVAGLAREAPVRVALDPKRVAACLWQAQAPPGVVRAIADAGGIEMTPVGAALHPPVPTPWHRVLDEPTVVIASPERLAAPVALWSLQHRGVDFDFVASAMASVTRLCRASAAARADACLSALVIAGAGAGVRDTVDDDTLVALAGLVERWVGVAPDQVAARSAATTAAIGALCTAGPTAPDSFQEDAARLLSAS